MAAAGRRTRIKETSEELKLENGTVKMPAEDFIHLWFLNTPSLPLFFHKVDNDNNQITFLGLF